MVTEPEVREETVKEDDNKYLEVTKDSKPDKIIETLLSALIVVVFLDEETTP